MRTTARRVISSVLALTLLSTAGLSQVLGPPRMTARSVATAPPGEDEQGWPGAGQSIELSIREDVRERCGRFDLPGEPYVIAAARGDAADVHALAGLAACLTEGPLAGQQLELFGPTELPGQLEPAADTGAAADLVRSLLHRSGVPYEQLVTRDVQLDPLISPHGAPRVVVGVSDPSES